MPSPLYVQQSRAAWSHFISASRTTHFHTLHVIHEGEERRQRVQYLNVDFRDTLIYACTVRLLTCTAVEFTISAAVFGSEAPRRLKVTFLASQTLGNVKTQMWSLLIESISWSFHLPRMEATFGERRLCVIKEWSEMFAVREAQLRFYTAAQFFFCVGLWVTANPYYPHSGVLPSVWVLVCQCCDSSCVVLKGSLLATTVHVFPRHLFFLVFLERKQTAGTGSAAPTWPACHGGPWSGPLRPGPVIGSDRWRLVGSDVIWHWAEVTVWVGGTADWTGRLCNRISAAVHTK